MDTVATQTVKFLNETAPESSSFPASPSRKAPSNTSSNTRVSLQSSRPRPPLFGTHLKILLLDERRCAHTFLDYRIGIPNQIKLVVDELLKNTNVAGLFRHRASVAEIESLRRSLEEERGIPPNTSIHTVAQCFLQWCYELPEPLLGYELYSPIQSCQEIENEDDRYRNIALLLDAVAWWNQPLLFQVMKLLFSLTRPGAMESNSLNIIAVSIFSTPFLLRSPQLGSINGRGMTIEEIDRIHMIAVASGSVTTQILIENQPIIFQHMGRYLQELQTSLISKCERLRQLQKESLQYLITHPVLQENKKVSEFSSGEMLGGNAEIDAEYGIDDLYDCSDLTIAREREVYHAMYALWEDLRPTHYRLNQYKKAAEIQTTPDSPSQPDSSPAPAPPSPSAEMGRMQPLFSGEMMSSLHDLDDVGDERDPRNDRSPRENDEELKEWENSVPATNTRLLKLMKSKRWEVCFPVENALHEFNSQPGGMLAIQCLSLWLRRFGDKASLIICEFALKRRELCSLPIVCVYLIQICLVSLKLITPQALTQVMSSKNPSQVLEINHIKLRTLARQESWSLLGDESCLEQLFSISLLTFDDLWKHMSPSTDRDLLGQQSFERKKNSSSSNVPMITTASQSSGGKGWLGFSNGSLTDRKIELSKDLLAGCMTGCRVLLDELLYVNHVATVEQLWKVWTEQRLLRQQIVVEAQLNRTKQVKIEKELQWKQQQQDLMNAEMEQETQKLIEKEIKSQNSCHISEYSEHSSVFDSAATTGAGLGIGAGLGKPSLVKMFGGVQSHIYGKREDMILSLHEMEVLEENLPLSLQCCDWDLKYSLAKDGASLETLVRLGKGCRRTILVIEDTHGCHFGAIIADDPWAITGDKYYGTGTCRVFSFHNTTPPTPAPSSLGTAPRSLALPPPTAAVAAAAVDPSHTFRIYETSMKNYYFMFTSQDMIGIGGGGGGFALLLDSDLNHGSSNANCETFDSPVLSTESEFICSRCNLYSIHRSDGSDDIDKHSRGQMMSRATSSTNREGGGSHQRGGEPLFKIEME
jgi:hypothetical protein